MAYANFANLLKQAIGLDAASIGISAIARAVRQRELACGLEETGAYWERLRSSADELQALVEAVVVPETWFFRDREAFAGLVRVACEHWPGAGPQARPMRETLRGAQPGCTQGRSPSLLPREFPWQ